MRGVSHWSAGETPTTVSLSPIAPAGGAPLASASGADLQRLEDNRATSLELCAPQINKAAAAAAASHKTWRASDFAAAAPLSMLKAAHSRGDSQTRQTLGGSSGQRVPNVEAARNNTAARLNRTSRGRADGGQQGERASERARTRHAANNCTTPGIVPTSCLRLKRARARAHFLQVVLAATH